MRLFEFQAKRLFENAGIAVPDRTLLETAAVPAGVHLPAMFKAQVPVGGRGKAGGVVRVDTADEAAATVERLFAMRIKGFPVAAVLAEPLVPVERELYLALTIDRRRNCPLLVASAAGGVDIETVARETPGRVTTLPVDPLTGVPAYAARTLAKALDLPSDRELGRVIAAMHGLLQDKDATLVEINPLAVTPDGLVALDAKVTLDDKAAFRHPELFADLAAEQARLNREERSPAEIEADRWGVSYVPLDGNVGLIADGAGTGMLTMDLVHAAGGRPANFCEMGGLSDAAVMEGALAAVTANPAVAVVLISLIGGLTRMDHMAEGIVNHLERNGATSPLVVRMCGTRAEVGLPLLEAVGVPAFEDLSEAVQAAVRLVAAGEGAYGHSGE